MAKKPQSERSDLMCPFFQKTLDKVCHNCALYVSIQQGDNPPVWDCSFAMTPFYQLQAAKQFHDGMAGIQKATESFRNEVVKANQQACQVIAATAVRRNGFVLLDDKNEIRQG